MGRPPIGRTAMSGAERAARHIAKLKASVPVAADDIVTNDIKPATMDVRKNLDAAIARIAELEADLAEWIKAGAGWRELQQQVDAMNTGGMFSRKEYKQIQECLHPDRVVGTPLERKYVEAFSLFGNAEKLLVKREPKLRPAKAALPNTPAEWAAARRATQEEKKRKRAAAKAAKEPKRQLCNHA